MNLVIKAIRKLAVSVALGAALATLAPSQAQASGALTPLGTTNYFSSAVAQVIGYPTNYYNGTNGFPMQTGHGVYIGNVKEFGINVSGLLRNTGAAAYLDISFVTSMAGGPPQITAGTNLASFGNTILTYNDWTSGTNGSGAYRLIVPLQPTDTNWFSWNTNIPSTLPISQANWIGVYSVSNNLASSCYITNASVAIGTKIIPQSILGN